MAAIAGHRVVVFLQENKTTDFYFRSMVKWGAVVDQHTNVTAPPNFDQPHDRNAWVHFSIGDYPALAAQIDNDTVIPFYSWLAKQFVFCDHHFGAGSNSTSGHMLAMGGQMPTMKNPPFVGPHPVWDIPSIFTAAQAAGVSWAAFPDQSGYPTKFYQSLTAAPGLENVHPPKDFIPMAKTGSLPQICYVWSPAGYDEHPPHDSDPTYVTKGQNLVWDRVQAVIDGGGWADTTFILSWDDWGGYADSVPTPTIETLPDAIHPDGYAAIGGSRIPLLMFGGKVKQGIEAQWHSHACIPKTIIDVFGLPAMGVPRVDSSPSLVDLVDSSLTRPLPPVPGSTIVQPPAPHPCPLRDHPPRGPARSTSACPHWSPWTGAPCRPPRTGLFGRSLPNHRRTRDSRRPAYHGGVGCRRGNARLPLSERSRWLRSDRCGSPTAPSVPETHAPCACRAPRGPRTAGWSTW